MDKKRLNTLRRILEYSQRVDVGIGFKDLKDGTEIFYNGEKEFPLASVFKIPVLMTLYKQQELGILSIDDYYTIEEKDITRDTEKEEGSGVIKELKPGVKMTLRDIAILMMIISDNNATDIIIKLVGKENIKKTLEAIGVTNTIASVTTKDLVFSKKPLNVKESNYSTPRDMIKILESIYKNTYLTRESCDGILDIMKKCQTGLNRIKKYLPFGVKIAHKTGSLSGPINVVNDSGIIFTRQKDYVLSVFVTQYNTEVNEVSKFNELYKNTYDAKLFEVTQDFTLKAEEIIANISKYIYDLII
ncbi:serine hydrolase [Candidatus Cryosericum odellii]|jgi:beta-lactamase class A|uniref:beta-lactamase n=1 Tax=Candidatus Cryosericum odellii TaxID=2290917 RepID=A0A398DEV0_9BACT|nr:serine hydrolase [Candidatus Cryosericum odellii]RIE10818.1 serine hydrolase [Candidatus Cryosericum odellii]